MSDHSVLIEDIAGRRRQSGIDDTDLRDAIGRLTVGDCVRLTLRSDQSLSGETVEVKITAIAGPGFRGALAARPASKGLADLAAGFALGFTADHIHSLPTPQSVRGRRRPHRLTGPVNSFRAEEPHG
jgi:hypothetical protein